MDILIRGIKMPTSCADCPIGNVLYCPLMPGVPALWAEYANAVLEERMHSDCPLISIQKHGRLIDADVLCKKLRNLPWNEYTPKAFAAWIENHIDAIIPANKEDDI